MRMIGEVFDEILNQLVLIVFKKNLKGGEWN